MDAADTRGRRGRGRLIALLIGAGLVALGAAGAAGVASRMGLPGSIFAPGPRVLLDVGGSGTSRTATFTAPAIWQLRYDYDCSSFRAPGNFAVTVVPRGGEAPDVAVNELGSGGRDATTVRTGGPVHLEVLSECSWHVTATE